ncbi:MAG: TetR/AcrR family transcriptional regulator [Pseudomonadota bacterium]
MARPGLTEGETRDLIVEKAEALFHKHGYKKATVADIAKACGFSSANVHRVFGTKSAINEEIASRLLGAFLEDAKRATRSNAGASARFSAFVTRLHDQTVATFVERPEMHEMCVAALEEDWGAVKAYRLAVIDTINIIVDEGVASGEFVIADTAQAAKGAMMALHRLLHPLVAAELRKHADEGAPADLISLILRSFK